MEIKNAMIFCRRKIKVCLSFNLDNPESVWNTDLMDRTDLPVKLLELIMNLQDSKESYSRIQIQSYHQFLIRRWNFVNKRVFTMFFSFFKDFFKIFTVRYNNFSNYRDVLSSVLRFNVRVRQQSTIFRGYFMILCKLYRLVFGLILLVFWEEGIYLLQERPKSFSSRS